MATSKHVAGFGLFAFLTGLALGAFATKREDDDLFGGVVGYSGCACCNKEDEAVDELDDTPKTTTLIDSLEDIEVPGDKADLLKVRVLGLERAKLVAMWGSKGVNHDQPTVFQRLNDLTPEHLVNIKNNSLAVTEDERRIITSILEDRVASGEVDPDVLGV